MATTDHRYQEVSSMDSRAELIRQRMSEVRRDIDGDFEELVEGAKSLVDWRDYVSKHPIPAIAVAATVGYLLVPRRSPDVGSVNQQAIKQRNGDSKKGPSIAGSIFSALASTLIRTVVSGVGQQVANAIADRSKTADANETEADLKDQNSRSSDGIAQD